MNAKKIVVDTSVLAAHLTDRRKRGRVSVLRRAMGRAFCYTTVFTVIELFAACTSERERRAVEDALQGLKILGMNGKSGKSVGRMVAALPPGAPVLRSLAAALCRESRLPLVTIEPERYRGTRKLRVIAGSAI